MSRTRRGFDSWIVWLLEGGAAVLFNTLAFLTRAGREHYGPLHSERPTYPPKENP